MATETTHAVCSEELNERFGPVNPKAVGKVQPRITEKAAAFIGQAPFMVLATAGADGTCDASPKGGEPGFVAVADDNTLLIPDFKGNNLFFGVRNILENPHVGLIFMIPGEGWTLRVAGRAQVVDDQPSLTALMGDSFLGEAPRAAIKVTVEECYFHCPKAFKRSDLWNPEKHGTFDTRQ